MKTTSEDSSRETRVSADATARFWQYLRDLWHYRDLFHALVERDIKVRYKQTLLGVAWVIASPLVYALILYIVLVRVARMPLPNDIPHMLFFMAGLIPWNCFSSGVSQAAISLEGSAGLISKVYFPRIIVPAASIMASVFDFLIGWIFFNVLAIYWGCWTLWFIPFTIVLLLLQLGATMGIGLVFAAVNAQYRDVRYVIAWMLQVGMWVTPVVWPMQRFLETRFEKLLLIFLYINPMAGVIESYRALLSPDHIIHYRLLAANGGVMILLLLAGVAFFRMREQKIVDYL